MKRTEFLKKTGYGLLCFSATPILVGNSKIKKLGNRSFKIEIEIFEAREDSWCHKKGDKFEYPRDMAKICPWLLASMHDFIRLLQNGVTLGWEYKGTPYEKVIDEDGITTEYIRCPDPTSNLVAKIIRTEISGSGGPPPPL